MLFGPGGVVAMLLGAWGAWWALRRGAGSQARTQWPAVVAFASAILAFVAWSALTEPIGLVREALQRRGEVRREALGEVPLAFWAGLRGLGAAWSLLLVGLIGSRWTAPPWRAEEPDRAEQGLAAAAALFAAVAAAVAAAHAPYLLDEDPVAWLASRETLQLGAWLTLGPAWVSLAFAALTGLRRTWRRRG